MAEPKPSKTPHSMSAEAMTLATGAAGGLLFAWLGVPGGAMSGAMVAVAVLSIYGRAASLSAPLRILALVTMGSAIGSVIGPETFANMAAYPVSVVLACLSAILVTLVSMSVWSLVFRWPLAMSVLSSVPGSSAYIMSVSMSMGSDAARIAVVQMSRMIFLVTLLPIIVVWESGGVHASSLVHAVDPPMVLLLTLAAGLAAGSLLVRLGMSGGMLLGALLASGALHFFEIAPGRSPGWFLNVGQVLLGAWAGSRFANFDWKLFWNICIGATVTVCASMAVTVAFAALATKLFGVSFGAALIAYAPGGQDAMMLLALALGVDPIFVSVNHLARYFMINLGLPFVVAWLRRVEAERKSKDGGVS